MPFASALSEHPVASFATGEVAGAVLEALGERPDLVLLFVTAPHAGVLDEIAATVEAVLHPLALVGCAAASVVGTGREVEETPSVSLWAARLGPLVPVALRAHRSGDGWEFSGWPTGFPFDPGMVLLVADPYTFPVDEFLPVVDADLPGVPVVGGYASAARGPGGNRLVTGGRTIDEGAVGVVIGPGVEVATVVSQGCRPFGQPLTVTRSERNVIQELAGSPVMDQLIDQAQSGLPPEDLALLESGGLHVGLVVDEHRAEFGPGDFIVRTVVGIDQDSGALAVNDEVPLGTTLQFHLRDATSADHDLRLLLRGAEADGALLFTCNGRGSRLFDSPDHDAAALADAVGSVPNAGFFAAGEFGPVAGHNFLHGFTASIVLFRDRIGTTRR